MSEDAMTTPTPKDSPPFDPPVFCSGIERDCKHGQLARSCNICELERDLAAALERAKSAGEDAFKLRVDLAAAQEALANLRKEYANSIEAWTGINEEKERAEALAESYRQDAERYRWLRDESWKHNSWSARYCVIAKRGEGLDAAIDAAREGK